MASSILFSDVNLIWRNMSWASRSGLKVLETVRISVKGKTSGQPRVNWQARS